MIGDRLDGRDVQGALERCADVVVVGSGPAGGAVTRALSAGGAEVLVVEAGPWRGPEDFPRSALRAMAASYRGLGATLALGSAPTPVVQGRMVGGASPINGAICWRMPRDVHQAWLDDDPALAEALPWEDLEAATDALEARWNVRPTEPAVAGRKNALLAAGAEALGLAHRPIRRNVDGCVGRARCLHGCPEGAKRSVDRTLIADALAAGATVLSSVEVTGLEVRGGRAVGVVGRAAGGGRVRVRARRGVVVAGGAVQSPALLLRSGLRQGPVGHGFQGHPGVAVAGRFAEPVRMHEGATQGHEVTGLRREGLKFETLTYDLALLAARFPGAGRGLVERVRDLDHWAVWAAAVRSTARGRVRWVAGRAVVTWSPSREDVVRYRRAVGVLGALFFAAGAERVMPGVRGLPAFVDDPGAFDALAGAGPLRAGAYRAVMTHLFGTCRLGGDPARSVVRPDFRHHAVDGLWVVDASVFPTNLGVNPQVPIAAVAHLAGRRILAA